MFEQPSMQKCFIAGRSSSIDWHSRTWTETIIAFTTTTFLPNIVEQLQSRCPTSWVASPQGNLLSSRHGGWWWQPLVPGVWTIIFARAVTLFSSPISPMSPTRPRCVVILEWMVLVLSHPFHYLDRTFRRSGSRFSWQHQPSPRWWWYCIMLEGILPRFPRFRLPDTVNRPFKLDPVVSAWLDFEVGLNWTVYRFTERQENVHILSRYVAISSWLSGSVYFLQGSHGWS